jgi:hypothetical protein
VTYVQARECNVKDIDSAELTFRLRAGAYAAIAFVVAIAGALALGKGIVVALLAGVGMALIVYFGPLLIADRSGRIGASIYQPSGSSTPQVREFSLADSLVARGLIDQAAEAYQLLSEDFPDDPEPRIRHARLLRDQSARYEESAALFKSILSLRALQPETELVVLRELVELHTHKQQQPTRALPYLARIAEKFGDSPTGAWARNEARDIKQQMQNEHERDISERT